MSKFKKNKLIIIIVLLCSVLILLNIKNVIIVNNYHKHKPDTILKRKIIHVNPINNNNNNLSLPKSIISNTIYNVAKTEFTAEPKKIVYNTKKYPEEELPQPVNVRTYCLYNNKHE
jgi:hypothetical protein